MDLTLENIVFLKPKKYSEYLVSKVRCSDEDFVIQFPKMIISDISEKSMELEFTNNFKEMYNFLKKLDTFIINNVQINSEEWFGKIIPADSIKKMYNSFIKAPKSTDNKCNLNFGFKIHKNQNKTLFLDKKGNEIDFSQLTKNETVECIAQLKYIFFSKDTCFPAWELISLKLYKKIEKVPKFGFIDDPDDKIVNVESDDESDINEIKFF